MARRGAGVVSLNTQIHILTTQILPVLSTNVFFSGSYKPHIQRKDEGVHAEVRQEQRWTY